MRQHDFQRRLWRKSQFWKRSTQHRSFDYEGELINMDINACIDHLGLNANRYNLTQAPPPHEIIEWHADNPDPQPSAAELETAWAAIEGAVLWSATRRERDELLRACDWCVGGDSPLSEAKQLDWETYRQELRNIPQDYATPDVVVWPDLPA